MSAFTFIKCPCCANGELMGEDAARALAELIEAGWGSGDSEHVRTELANIRNTIINALEPGLVPEPTEEDLLL